MLSDDGECAAHERWAAPLVVSPFGMLFRVVVIALM